MNNKTMGKLGEEIAQNFLKKQGFKILETNFRYSKLSEIDIIATKKDVLHFVEVKTRSSNLFGSPIEAISEAKLSSIFTCAKYYLSNLKKTYKKIQIDAIGIILEKNQEPKISFVEDINL